MPCNTNTVIFMQFCPGHLSPEQAICVWTCMSLTACVAVMWSLSLGFHLSPAAACNQTCCLRICNCPKHDLLHMILRYYSAAIAMRTPIACLKPSFERQVSFGGTPDTSSSRSDNRSFVNAAPLALLIPTRICTAMRAIPSHLELKHQVLTALLKPGEQLMTHLWFSAPTSMLLLRGGHICKPAWPEADGYGLPQWLPGGCSELAPLCSTEEGPGNAG